MNFWMNLGLGVWKTEEGYFGDFSGVSGIDVDE